MKANSLENGPVKDKSTLSRFIVLYPKDPKRYRCVVCNMSTYVAQDVRTRNRSPVLHATCERYVPNELDLLLILEVTRTRFGECLYDVAFEKREGLVIPNGLYAILQLANLFFKKDLIPNIKVIQQDSNIFGNIRAILYSCMSNYKNIMPCHECCHFGLDIPRCGYACQVEPINGCTIFRDVYNDIFDKPHRREEEVIPVELPRVIDEIRYRPIIRGQAAVERIILSTPPLPPRRRTQATDIDNRAPILPRGTTTWTEDLLPTTGTTRGNYPRTTN